MDLAVRVRQALPEDMPAVQRIYAHNVRHGRATFEETAPTVEEMRARRTAVLSAGFPYLVADLDGAVVGFSYASGYRPRPAYRYTVESSVYVADAMQGLGIGRALLNALIDACEAGSWRQMIAVIGDSNNAASVALHQRLGFRMIGTIESVGFKRGRWVDTILMQRALGDGDNTRPDGLGARYIRL
ncbi:MAG: GNAT family N-acetyltransferase [Alphaproteobacteria bacterium]|nr:GNAT family N-acetyltransferase [Alphaproteobacteria bacterium]